jgi:hypothetical protein
MELKFKYVELGGGVCWMPHWEVCHEGSWHQDLLGSGDFATWESRGRAYILFHLRKFFIHSTKSQSDSYDCPVVSRDGSIAGRSGCSRHAARWGSASSRTQVFAARQQGGPTPVMFADGIPSILVARSGWRSPGPGFLTLQSTVRCPLVLSNGGVRDVSKNRRGCGG